MSYYQQQYHYQPQYIENVQQLVLEKLCFGLTFGAVISWAIAYFRVDPIFALFAFIAEIIAIIGYFVAKNESTIEKLYYLFVGSSSMLLGYTFQFILSSASNGTDVIAVAFGITALIVGGIYYYTSTRKPDVSNMVKYLWPLGLIFIFILILSIFIQIGSFGLFLLSVFGAILFTLYLYYDFGRLMRGELSSPARMAWKLYWDILLVFRYILHIVYALISDR